jgi:hypothetical protein
MTKKRYFTKENRELLNLKLKEEQWEYVYRADETNTSYQIFLGILDYHFNIAFPLKRAVIKINQIIPESRRVYSNPGRKCPFHII